MSISSPKHLAEEGDSGVQENKVLLFNTSVKSIFVFVKEVG